MVFCNVYDTDALGDNKDRHNPYFNRWFSAIQKLNEENFTVSAVTILILIDGFLQCMLVHERVQAKFMGHNPYFNRWFSAI